MKFRLLLLFVLTSFTTFSQEKKTFNLDHILFSKIPNGYLICGDNNNIFTLTKYDNKLAKVKEYTRDIKEFKFKAPYVKKFPNYIQLVFFTKMFPAAGKIINLDTNLVTIRERDFGPADYEKLKKTGLNLEGDKFYPSLSFDEERRIENEYSYYDDKVVYFNPFKKKLYFGKYNSSEVITYYDKVNAIEVQCEGKVDVGNYGFIEVKDKLYLYIKTKTEKIESKKNMLGGHLSASTGNLVIAEIDKTANTVKKTINISDLNKEFDFSLSKMFYDKLSNKLIVTGTYLDRSEFEKSTSKEGSEATGWYACSIDESGKMTNSNIVKNDSTIFENIKDRRQINRSMIVRSIEQTNAGEYVMVVELNSKIDWNNSTPGNVNYIRTYQPLGYHIVKLNAKMEITKNEFVPLKVWNKREFRAIENGNLVKPDKSRSTSYFYADPVQSFLVYSYGEYLIASKKGEEFSFLCELLETDIESASMDNSKIRNSPWLHNILQKESNKMPNSTWVYPAYGKNSYYVIQWKEKEIVFDLQKY